MSSIFEKNFDMEGYISKKILEMPELNQRRLLKETVSHLFMSLHTYMEEEYERLEEKIFHELDVSQRGYFIETSIISKEYYDETEEIMVPMIDTDAADFYVDTEELMESIEKNQPFLVHTVFLEADYLVVKEIGKSRRKFIGIIHSNEGEFRGIFEIKPNKVYLHMIQKLYEMFQNNSVAWMTVCAPYLYKMFDVFLCSIENWEEGAAITEISIDFEEYNQYVHYNCIPLWNITTEIMKTSSYPEPCLDKIHYQHIIYRHKLNQEADYLVGNLDVPLKEIRRIDGDLIITCEEANQRKWLLYKIAKVGPDQEKYEGFSNRILRDFSDVLSSKYQRNIKTKAELNKFIQALNYSEYVKFDRFELTNGRENAESYNMDKFIEDEFRTGKKEQNLILYFRVSEPDYFLNRDIVSYIVTQVQKIFPEYQCMGKLA